MDFGIHHEVRRKLSIWGLGYDGMAGINEYRLDV